MLGGRPVIGLTFATALSDHDRADLPGPVCFLTPAQALRTHGVDWATALQGAVQDWCPDSLLVVDATAAPGFAMRAVLSGLETLYCPEEDPAYRDLRAYADAHGAGVLNHCPTPQDHWTPHVPTRKRKRVAKSDT